MDREDGKHEEEKGGDRDQLVVNDSHTARHLDEAVLIS